MVIVALAAIAAAVLEAFVFVRILREERRAEARARAADATERARLIDQLCHLSGRPWTPPPRVDVPRVEEPALDYIEDADQLIEVE